MLTHAVGSCETRSRKEENGGHRLGVDLNQQIRWMAEEGRGINEGKKSVHFKGIRCGNRKISGVGNSDICRSRVFHVINCWEWGRGSWKISIIGGKGRASQDVKDTIWMRNLESEPKALSKGKQTGAKGGAN